MTTYSTTAIATNDADNTVTVASIANMFPGLPITFSGTTFGGITEGSTYYIGTITYGYPTSKITLSSLPGGAVFVLTTDSGSMTATWESGGQLIIDTTPPGESLNSAFTKINVNFDQIWAAGPVNSNIKIADNTIYTLDTNGDLVLNPNGIGNVVANADVVPDQTLIRNLGSPEKYWNDLYVEYGYISNVTLSSLTLPVANLHILGGNAGQFLQTTDGAGNLIWALPETAAGGNNTQIQFNNEGMLDGSATFTFNANTNTITLQNVVTTGQANLNSVGNVFITGGAAGYVLQTDGLGNLSWTSPTGNVTQILDQQLYGDGSTLAFNLITPSVNNAVLVSINGVMQIPTVAYSVAGDVITFTEPPLSTDLVDIRFMIFGASANNNPGGATGFIQFNEAGGFGGSANLRYFANTGNLYSTNVQVTGNVTASYYLGDGSLLTGITAAANTGTITFANNVIGTSNANAAINILGPQQTSVSQATGGNSAVSQLLWATNISALTPEQIPNGVVGGNTWGTQISVGNTGAVIGSNSVIGLRTWTFGTDGTLSGTGGIASGNITATGFVSATGTIIANVNVSAVGNVSGSYIIGNGSLLTGLPDAYGNSNVATYLNGGIGNVIPVASNSYSLGNATNQWLDLWVSNNTIYINSVPVTLGADNTLAVNGNPLVAVTSNSVANIGNFVFNGNELQNLNGASVNNGDLTHGQTSALNLPVNGNVGPAVLLNTYGNVSLQAGNAAVVTSTWQFRNDGNVVLPGEGLLGNPYGDVPNVAGLQAGVGAYAVLASNDLDQFVQTDANAVYIGTDFSGNIKTWIFDRTGNITLPGNTSSINYANGEPYGGTGTTVVPGGNTTEIQFNNAGSFGGSANLTFDSANAELNVTGTISASGNVAGNYIIGDGSLLTGITVTANTGNITFSNSTIQGPSFGVVPSANSSVYIQPTVDSATVFQFTGSGNMVLPGNTFAINYANGTPVSLGGNYSDANVATFLGAFGSNAISTSGNVTAGNFVGNISITGNVQGTSANVELVAGVNTWTFDNTGNLTIPGTSGGLIKTVANASIGIVAMDNGTNNPAQLMSWPVGQANPNTIVSTYSANVLIQTNVNSSIKTWTFDNLGVLTVPTIGGDEGGEINFGIPVTNTTLTSPVKFDVYQDRIRFFDGSTKGAYIDLSQAATGVGTLLNNRVSGVVNAGTFVTMDNIKATVTTTGNRGLSLATVTGSFTYDIGGTYAGAGVGSGGTSLGGQTLTTTPTSSIFGWGFTNQGDIATYIITNISSMQAYRITLQIGNGFNNNRIVIERLI